MIKIFEVTLFGEDAKMFCAMSKKDKTDWIKANTNQKSLALIKEYVDNAENSKTGKCGCGCK